MSSRLLTLGCTALLGTNKVGELKPNAKGSYEMVLGALEFPNSIGEVYCKESAKKMFRPDGPFDRSVKGGYCGSELGHPKRMPGMTERDFMVRIMTIEETRVCNTIEEVWIDANSVMYEGRPVIAIRGLIHPSGPYAETLERSLNNPKENVAYSVRSLTNNTVVNGQIRKEFVELATFDKVTRPGLAPANKYCVPSLESVGDEMCISLETMERMVDGTNSNISMEASDTIKRIITSARKSVGNRSFGGMPASTRWR